MTCTRTADELEQRLEELDTEIDGTEEILRREPSPAVIGLAADLEAAREERRFVRMLLDTRQAAPEESAL